MIKNKGNAEDQIKKKTTKNKIENYNEKRNQITSIIKGCSLVQFEYNCAVLCNHLYRVTQASRFYMN